MKLWGGRFSKNTEAAVDDFNASIHFDCELAEVDILGSLAHVKMLGKCNILTDEEVKKIEEGLQKLAIKVNNNSITYSVLDEDIHMNIERLLSDDIGELAGKLHTGRSRNDQVALDMHLYLRKHVFLIIEKLYCLQKTLLSKAEQHMDTLLPGYTHLQRAQPVSLAHHLLAYCAMLQRDVERLISSWPRMSNMPLGAGALAGSRFDLDRSYVADLLHFDNIYENSMDAVSDRDFVIEFLSHASIIMMHLSRLSEELILWSSQEFGFIELDDAYSTGSSMMPQKKNPDVAELVRGKTGRVYGALIGILTVFKGLPLCYNKDMQEDKEGLFDTLKTLHDSLGLYVPMISTMKVNDNIMRKAVTNDFSNATEIADYLVTKAIPFREAHSIVGKIVSYCIDNNKLLMDMTLKEYQTFSAVFDQDVFFILQPENVVKVKKLMGGTAQAAVFEQIGIVQNKLLETSQWMDDKRKIFTECLGAVYLL